MQAAAPILAAAGAATTAFKYNRVNYLWDATLRFNRYVTGYQFAIAQAQQYRDDIRDFTELTVSKQETYTIMGTVFMILNVMLMLSGRLGIFGPAPPGWVMGLYWGHATTALCFLLTMIWLSVHATGRCMSGGAVMLTRHVRLPLPTAKQLDKARKTGNSFEQQRVGDTFRVPFVAPAPRLSEEANIDLELGITAPKASPSRASTRRMPRWYLDEQSELQGSNAGPNAGRGDVNPTHFELYRGLQQEWWCHETYVRVGMLYFMSAWLTAVNLYTQCHCFSELRALWPAWAITPLFCTMNWIVLQIELCPNNRTRLERFRMEHVYPWMPVVSCFGMSFEYSSVHSGGGWRALIYVCAWCCYAIQFLWIVKLYDLAEPTEQGEHPDVTGAWWPEEWFVPPAFNRSIYLVAAPKALGRGSPTCLQIEMKQAKGMPGAEAPALKQRRVSPQLFPWRVFRGALFSSIAAWVLIIIGRIWEQCHGERMFMKQEGREVRFPATAQGFVTPWTRRGHRDEMAHSGGSDRRLESQRSKTEPAEELQEVAQELFFELSLLSGSLAEKRNIFPRPIATPATLRNEAWPAGFIPSFLASGPGPGHLVVAVARDRTQGVLLDFGPSPERNPGLTSRTAFHFRGLPDGEILATSWGASGLVVTTSGRTSGKVIIAECSGLPVAGTWSCEEIGAALPVETGSVVTAARVPGTTVTRAAVSFADDSAVALFESTPNGNEWFPTGEVSVPNMNGHELQLSFSSSSDALLISQHDGSLMHWRLSEPDPVLAVAPQAPGVWGAACSLPDGTFLRLLAPSEGAAPQLVRNSGF